MRTAGAERALRIVITGAAVVLAAGCVSRAAMQRMQDQLDYLEASHKRMEKDLVRIDSLVTQSSTESRQTRAEVSTSLNDFQQEVGTMRETIDELRRSVERHPPQIVYQAPPAADSSASKAGQASGTAGATVGPETDPYRLDSLAFLDVRKGNYELAIGEFRDILRYFSNTEYAPKAHYWIGECWYSLGGGATTNQNVSYYDSAIVEFSYLVENYQASERVPTALYKLGRCYEELGRPRQARRYYEQVVQEYPKSLEAKPAQSRLDELK